MSRFQTVEAFDTPNGVDGDKTTPVLLNLAHIVAIEDHETYSEILLTGWRRYYVRPDERDVLFNALADIEIEEMQTK